MDEQVFNSLIAQYKGLSKEITFAKKMNLVVANGTFVFYGIIFKFPDKLPGATYVTFFIWLASLFYLISSHLSLKNNQLRLEAVQKKLPLYEDIKDAIEQEKVINLSCYIPYLYYALVTVGFLVTLAKLFAEAKMDAKTLSTIGLSLDFVGVVVLFIYANKTVGAVTQTDIDHLVSKWCPRIGYILIAFGFLIQIVGNYFPK